MGLRHFITALLVAMGQLVSAADEIRGIRESAPPQVTTRYCDDETKACYSEYTARTNVVYRIAISDKATAAPFDILLQIVAPVSVGWAGLAWGGKMTGNPLTLGWPNGQGAMASARWASSHTMPEPYDGIKLDILKTSTTNSTHWRLDVLVHGSTNLPVQPDRVASLAFATSHRAVSTPSDPDSSIPIHNAKNRFFFDFGAAKIPDFDSIVGNITDTGTSASSPSVSGV